MTAPSSYNLKGARTNTMDMVGLWLFIVLSVSSQLLVNPAYTSVNNDCENHMGMLR